MNINKKTIIISNRPYWDSAVGVRSFYFQDSCYREVIVYFFKISSVIVAKQKLLIEVSLIQVFVCNQDQIYFTVFHENLQKVTFIIGVAFLICYVTIINKQGSPEGDVSLCRRS